MDNSVATNVYIQCTSPAAVSGGIELEECVRIGGLLYQCQQYGGKHYRQLLLPEHLDSHHSMPTW